LRSPTVLDPGFSAGKAFGANGTPTAILVHMTTNISEIFPGIE
jgi:hypothetical protein